MAIFRKIGDGITYFNKLVFQGAAWLIYPLITVIIYEVIMRYFFVRPTNFSFDLSWMIFGAMGFLAGGYVLHLDGHVKADVLTNMLPKKVRAIVTCVCYCVFFFPLMISIVRSSNTYFLNSYRILEKSPLTSWEPLMWPSKLILFISFVLLLAQGVVKFCETAQTIFEKGEVK